MSIGQRSLINANSKNDFRSSRLKANNFGTIHSNSERSEHAFLTWSWRFFMSYQFEFKLEKKVLGFRNMQEKLENISTHF